MRVKELLIIRQQHDTAIMHIKERASPSITIDAEFFAWM